MPVNLKTTAENTALLVSNRPYRHSKIRKIMLFCYVIEWRKREVREIKIKN